MSPRSYSSQGVEAKVLSWGVNASEIRSSDTIPIAWFSVPSHGAVGVLSFNFHIQKRQLSVILKRR